MIKNLLLFATVIALLFKGASALAEGVEDLSIEAISSIDPDRSLSFSAGIVLFLLILIAVTLVLSGVVSEAGSSRTFKKAQELFLPIKIVKDSHEISPASLAGYRKFLHGGWKKRGRIEQHRLLSPTFAGNGGLTEILRDPGGFSLVHLRDLSPKNATLVVGEHLKKGQRLSIDLASLPGFLSPPFTGKPSEGSGPKGEVIGPMTVTAEVKTCRPQLGDHTTYMAGIKFVEIEENLQQNLNFYVENLCLGRDRSGGLVTRPTTEVSKDPGMRPIPTVGTDVIC